MPWSIPIGKPLVLLAGIVAGELTQLAAKHLEMKPETAVLAAKITSGLVSMGVDAGIAAVAVDAAGVVTSPATGWITSELFDPNGTFGIFATEAYKRA